MKVLILGSNGMLGRQLMKLYGQEAAGWDRQDFDFADVAKQKSSIAHLAPSIVINCAAYNNVDGAEQDQDTAFRINAESVGDLAKICQELDIPLVHFSTNYVFDGKKGEYLEDDIPNPLSVYGSSKYKGEGLLQKNCDKFYLIRTSVLFGNRVEGSESKKSFAEFVLEQASKKEPIYAYTDEVGCFTYAVDLAEKVKLLLEKQSPFGIYHIVNDGSANRFEFATETLKNKGLLEGADLRPTTFAERPRAAVIPKRAILLNSKLPPVRHWKAALKEFLNNVKFG